ncbi:MAG: hypothetical protein ILP18_08465 [Treponema sp.]|nr:hypothetical protein [Treponema sp.]
MIKEFLLSAAILFAASVIGTAARGGDVGMLFFPSDMLLLLLILVMLGILVFASGHGRAFVRAFCTGKAFEVLGPSQLRKIDKALAYACKAAAYEALFLVCIATVYYYVNWMNVQTLGYQLSLMILSARFICSIEAVLFCMRGKLRRQIILFMDEKEAADGSRGEAAGSGQTAALLPKLLLSVAAIVGLSVLTVLLFTRDESGFAFGRIRTWVDITSLLLILLPSLCILMCSGLCGDFIAGIRGALSGRRISIPEGHRLVGAISTARQLTLLAGFIMTLLGYYAVLAHIEETESLGPAMVRATIPCFYAVILSLLLLHAEARLDCLSE